MHLLFESVLNIVKVTKNVRMNTSSKHMEKWIEWQMWWSLIVRSFTRKCRFEREYTKKRGKSLPCLLELLQVSLEQIISWYLLSLDSASYLNQGFMYLPPKGAGQVPESWIVEPQLLQGTIRLVKNEERCGESSGMGRWVPCVRNVYVILLRPSDDSKGWVSQLTFHLSRTLLAPSFTHILISE